ncbi:MAG: type pilus assembly protein PilM, partial [Candidatus Atribacteria bacterium]|nr:type pilus assembly protein PilM [Candidatus Atribacteria bacterium]
DIPYQIQEAISETSGDMVTELRRSLSFLQTEFGSNSLRNLFLTGGGGRIVFLRQILVENLPVNIGEISPLVVKKGEFPAEVYLSALGASLWS